MTQATPPRAVVREVTHDLQQAEADKLVQVVAILDEMAQRGAADDVLVPLRPRLARLRPPRPLRFSRLLFRPLDAVIVPATQWRRGEPSIPRSIIQPVTDLVRALLGPACAEVDAMLAGRSASDHMAVQAAGNRLWPLAARALAGAVAPMNWTAQTGLQPADFTQLAHQVSAALSCAPIQTTEKTVESFADRSNRAVAETVNQSPQVLSTVMALLLSETPDPQTLITAVEPTLSAPQMAKVRSAIDQGYDFLVNTVAGAPPLPADLAVAEQDLRRAVELVEAHGRRIGQTAERSSRVNDMARRMSQEARTRFETALSAQILLPMQKVDSLSSQDIATVEAMARDLRRFESTARRLGGREHYDRQLQASGEALRPKSEDAPQTQADKLRMVEILLGAERAYRMYMDLRGIRRS